MTTAKASAGAPAAEGPREKPPTWNQARPFVRRQFAKELPELMTRYASAAKEGDIASLKVLISLSGFDRVDEQAKTGRGRRGKSFARMLLDDLKKNPPVPRKSVDDGAEPWWARGGATERGGSAESSDEGVEKEEAASGSDDLHEGSHL